MVRQLDSDDFRARRKVLESDDFASTDGEPDPPPSDLISEEAWDGIMTLPDDVAIRTTSHLGEWVALLYHLWGGWVESFPRRSIIVDAMLDCADDFSAALFNLVHGYYKQAIGALRNALETTVLACECSLSGSADTWHAWQSGEEIAFRKTLPKLAATAKFTELEARVRLLTGGGLFPEAENKDGIAWVRNLYQRLSNFSHARGDSTNGVLWQSNGPVYSEQGMRTSCHLYLETYALLVLLLKVTWRRFRVPGASRHLFKLSSLQVFCPEPFPRVCEAYAMAIDRM
ncbi:hypothetical protein [Paraburkholderia sp. SUR17]|uniref:hypothetical protein n=1 Tax=Paraburkholderia sp. SUR17 TaxID=3034358 RepID=UPI002407BB4B|nr:hypothetical protein [Paraburkholderia sp. SUR17]WEY41539.1 hypothetical protein P2869_29215 [Paraburkholderia sp. SUR17]